jgi:hypothetical protein
MHIRRRKERENEKYNVGFYDGNYLHNVCSKCNWINFIRRCASDLERNEKLVISPITKITNTTNETFHLPKKKFNIIKLTN